MFSVWIHESVLAHFWEYVKNFQMTGLWPVSVNLCVFPLSETSCTEPQFIDSKIECIGKIRLA